MSFDATNWAIKQRGLKPAAKIVLWHLCDRYHPDHGCFPSQDTLADDCELPRSTLNVHLNDLEAAGLIAREQRRSKGTRRQESTRYRFPFEVGFEAQNGQNPCPETGHGSDEAVSRNAGEPCPENGKSRVQNLDSNPVREPVREPVKSREGVRERSDEEQEPDDHRKIDAAYWRLIKAWPKLSGMPKGKTRAAWDNLTDAERREAELRFPQWIKLLEANGKDHTPGPWSYFTEKLWLDVPALAKAAKPANGMAAPFGKLWTATRLTELLLPPTGNIPGPTGFEQAQIREGKLSLHDVRAEKRKRFGWPSVNEMQSRALERQARGWLCPLVLKEATADFRQVKHDDAVQLQAWHDEHERRGWPPLTLSRQHEWIWLPPIHDGETPAVALERFADAISDYLTTRRQGDEYAA